MDRAMLLQHLIQADRHIIESRQHISRQRELIDYLTSSGNDIAGAVALLRQFEEALELHRADRDRIRLMLESL